MLKEELEKIFKKHRNYNAIKKYDIYSDLLSYTHFLDEESTIKERYYYIINGLIKPKLCPICFNKIKNYKVTYCSNSCAAKGQLKYKNKNEINQKISKSVKIYMSNISVEKKKLIQKKKSKSLKIFHDEMDNKRKNNIVLKRNKTNHKKYGVENYSNSEAFNKAKSEIINKIKISKKSSFLSRIKNKEHYVDKQKFEDIYNQHKSLFSLTKYFNVSYNNLYLKLKEYNINMKHTFRSHYENTIICFLEENNIKYISNSKSIIPPKEVDIFLPDHKIAIEFNGDYWHSTVFKLKDYHINKTRLCEEKGIRLIHIFEYEFNKDKEKILNWLLIQIKRDIVIYARKCKIKEITNKVKAEFLEKYHLQGNDKSSIKLGLFHEDELVSVMTFGKRRFDKKDGYELYRYASKYHTIGGASKIFKYFNKNLNPANLNIISYQNLSKFNGNLYEKLGFKYSHTSSPNYVYVKGDNVLSRYQCQKHKLVNEGYDKLFSESEIMKERGYLKIYDCGNNVWNLKNN